MKCNTALTWLVAFEALLAMHIRAGAVVVDRTSENNDGDVIYSTNVADAAASNAKPVRLLPADSGGLSSPTDSITSFNPFDVKYIPPQQQRHLKLSKKIGPSDLKIPVPPPFDVTGGGITGVYIYTNKCNNVFQVTIDCGIFGDEDPDLCLFSEFSRGTLVETPEQSSEPLPGREGLYFLPDAAITEDGIINPDIVCEFSGTFRRSSLMVEEENGSNQLKLKALPLASSNGCGTTTTNFKLVVKGTMKKVDDEDETILELEFSNDFGFTYYTDTKVCPHSYIGQKVDEGNSNGQRALAQNGSDNKHVSNNFVVRRQLFLSNFLRKWVSFWRKRKFCWSSCEIPVPSSSPSTKPTVAPTPSCHGQFWPC